MLDLLKENKIVLIDNDIPATSVVAGASGEMYLCYPGLFSLMQAQHGNSGKREGKHARGILRRNKASRATGVERPAEKGVRERSSQGPRLSLKEPLLGGGAQEEEGALEQSPDFIQ